MTEFLKQAAENLGRLGREALELLAWLVGEASRLADMVPGGEYTRATFDAIGPVGQAALAAVVWVGCYWYAFVMSK